MRAWMVFLAMVPACGFHSSSNPNGNQDANGGDAKIDAAPDAPGPEYGTFIKIGFPSVSAVPTATLMWMNNVAINTDGSMCDKLNNQASRYCVIAGSSITLASGTKLTAHGSKPLVLLATSTFDLEGMIDVSSKRGGTPGAGAAASCPNTTAATGNSGGFGGSFGSKGGDGGTIAGTTPDGTKGIAAPALSTLPSDLRGGCPGGNGSSTTTNIAPAGGSGGGAVLIIAVDKIQMNGTINASGAGGSGGPGMESGGGGGGSGGMIILDAPMIAPGTSASIWLFANGGGGGQGGTPGGSGSGDNGLESSDPLTAGAGGNNTNTNKNGGSGGDGAAGILPGSDAGAATGNGGGGAGGGGTGFIRTLPIAGSLISPPLPAP